MTVRVDELLIAPTKDFMAWLIKLLEDKFGPIKRQQLPTMHTGIWMERLANGGLLWTQHASFDELSLITIPR